MKKIETVKIVRSRFGYYPRRFMWRGQLFEVLHVEWVKSARRDWPRRQQSRTYGVSTAQGTFVLQHDLLRDMWHVQKAPPAIERSRAVTSRKRASGKGRVAHGHRLVVVR